MNMNANVAGTHMKNWSFHLIDRKCDVQSVAAIKTSNCFQLSVPKTTMLPLPRWEADSAVNHASPEPFKGRWCIDYCGTLEEENGRLHERLVLTTGFHWRLDPASEGHPSETRHSYLSLTSLCHRVPGWPKRRHTTEKTFKYPNIIRER
jgi:hypothetical protein